MAAAQCWRGRVANSLGCVSLYQHPRGLFVLVVLNVVLMAEEGGGGVFTYSNDGLVIESS